MPRDSYTRYPRPILWLVQGGTLSLPGEVELTLPSFYLSKKPVTNVQFEAYEDGFRRSSCSPEDDDPATGVSFQQAQGYCAWYAEISRKPMRLPTEAEWEHACRADTTTRTFWGDQPSAAEEFVWDRENASAGPGRYETRRPNPNGLLVMLGGVWEWTASPVIEGKRILRGGSFRQHRDELHSGLRRTEAPDTHPDDAGFRLARSF